MREQPGSTYTAALRELRFAIIDDPEIVRRIHVALPIQQPDRNHSSHRMPWFTISTAITLATDEAGQTWVAVGKVDLSDFGFEDRTEETQALLLSMNATDPKPPLRYN